jgi:glycine cleavage system regulatory protein
MILAQFFASNGINIEDINAHTYHTYAGTRMMSMTVNINIGVDVHIPSLRDKIYAVLRCAEFRCRDGAAA